MSTEAGLDQFYRPTQVEVKPDTTAIEKPIHDQEIKPQRRINYWNQTQNHYSKDDYSMLAFFKRDQIDVPTNFTQDNTVIDYRRSPKFLKKTD